MGSKYTGVRIVSLATDVRMDVVSQRAPAGERTAEAKLLSTADRAVKRHPRHHLGVREVMPSTAPPRCLRRGHPILLPAA